MILVQRLKMMSAFFALVKNPANTDRVFEMSNAGIQQRGPLLDSAVAHAAAVPGFKELAEINYKPKIPSLQELATYPVDTFGRVFADHMLSNGLEVDFFPTMENGGPETYLVNRGRSTHDFWHVLTGFDTSVPGEIGLQAFTLAQIHSAFSALLIAGGLLHSITRRPDLFDDMIDQLFEGYQIGRNAKPLLGIKLEELLTEDIEMVRRQLGIVPCGRAKKTPHAVVLTEVATVAR